MSLRRNFKHFNKGYIKKNYSRPSIMDLHSNLHSTNVLIVEKVPLVLFGMFQLVYNSNFGPWVYQLGSIVITLVRLPVCLSVYPSLNISETEILKKNLNLGIKCHKFGFLDIFTETGHWKFLIFLHDGREQYGASFECGAIFEKNLNLRIIRGFNRD